MTGGSELTNGPCLMRFFKDFMSYNEMILIVIFASTAIS